MISVDLQTFLKIHDANYATNSAASAIAEQIRGEVGGAIFARVDRLPAFEDYCEIIDSDDAAGAGE